MASHILGVVLPIHQVSVEQAWILSALLAWGILLVYFMREVWLRCDS
jgi:hypothetical protein